MTCPQCVLPLTLCIGFLHLKNNVCCGNTFTQIPGVVEFHSQSESDKDLLMLKNGYYAFDTVNRDPKTYLFLS